MSLSQEAQEAGEKAYLELIEGEDCTCETCVVREILTAAWGVLLQMAIPDLEQMLEETQTTTPVLVVPSDSSS